MRIDLDDEGGDDELKKRFSENEVGFICERKRLSWTWHLFRRVFSGLVMTSEAMV